MILRVISFYNLIMIAKINENISQEIEQFLNDSFFFFFFSLRHFCFVFDLEYFRSIFSLDLM